MVCDQTVYAVLVWTFSGSCFIGFISCSQLRKNNWRQKHEDFIRSIKQAREVQQVITQGGKVVNLPQPPANPNPDYVPCPHCGRRFAPRPAQRHIPKCQHIRSRPPPPPRR